MITVDDAFKKFNSRQELNPRESKDVSRRHKEVRDHVASGLRIDYDFLTGSYPRWTKTKPLKDVDVMCVLHENERHYRRKHPRVVLERVKAILDPIYGEDNVKIDGLAVTVSFGVVVSPDEETDDQVLSIDVVPAFAKGDHFEIPDEKRGVWIETNPRVHYDLAVAAHEAYSDQWKPIVRATRRWNRHHGKPVHSGFFLEVMALDVLAPPYSGSFPYELKAFFATAADRIHETWADPAGLGPDVSETMTSEEKAAAAKSLRNAEAEATRAIRLEREGKHGDALETWRRLFGPQFPLS